VRGVVERLSIVSTEAETRAISAEEIRRLIPGDEDVTVVRRTL